MIKSCKVCGGKIRETDVFCVSCGARVNTAKQQASDVEETISNGIEMSGKIDMPAKIKQIELPMQIPKDVQYQTKILALEKEISNYQSEIKLILTSLNDIISRYVAEPEQKGDNQEKDEEEN